MRGSGILMPVFSLPSRYGIGTFGKEAYRFIDFLQKAGQSYWQILPLNPTNFGDSPYQSFSSYAGNPYFIDLDMLIEDGLLTRDEVEAADFGSDRSAVDYGLLYENRLPVLRRAYSRFKPDRDFEEFCKNNDYWLCDYALFMVRKNQRGDTAWSEWEQPLRDREEGAIAEARERFTADIDFYNFIQFLFFSQWLYLH